MKKGKSKGLVFAEPQECLNKYGVSNGDLITCPMGVELQVVGMEKSDQRLYARFQGNIISPLQCQSKEELLQSGYKVKEFEQSEIFTFHMHSFLC